MKAKIKLGKLSSEPKAEKPKSLNLEDLSLIIGGVGVVPFQGGTPVVIPGSPGIPIAWRE